MYFYRMAWYLSTVRGDKYSGLEATYLNLSHTTSSKPHSCHINFAKDSIR